MASSAGPRYAPPDPTLPKPWRGLIDGTTGYLYFWNPETKAVQYDRPTGPPPPAPAPLPAPVAQPAYPEERARNRDAPEPQAQAAASRLQSAPADHLEVWNLLLMCVIMIIRLFGVTL